MVKQVCHNPTIHLIGDIAVTFGTLEFYLEGAIWLLLAGSDSELRRFGEAITAEMSFDRKIHAFASMYKLKFPAEAQDPVLAELVADLFDVQGKRNHILHAAWSYSDKHKAFTWMKASAKAKHGLRRKVGVVPPAKVAEVRAQIVDVVNRFAQFAMERIQNRPDAG